MFIYLDLFPNVKEEKVTEELIARIVSKLCDFIKISNDRNERVINYMSPEEIQQEIDFSLQDEAANLQQLLNITDKILKYSVRTG